MSAQQRIHQLIELINNHNQKYYQLSEATISDSEYDDLYQELETLEKQNPELILPNSPTQNIGNDLIQQFQEVEHIQPLKSLNKIYSLEELYKWYHKYLPISQTEIFLSVEPKIDGFSVVLHYEKGFLVRALSRGDGIKGNNLTHNIKSIKNIPLQINDKRNLVVRGEVFINKLDFKNINDSQTEKEYSNPRNFAAGVIRRIDRKDVENVPLQIFVYDAFFPHDDFSSHSTMLFFLKEQGFPVTPYTTFFENIENLLFQDNIQKWITLSTYPLEQITNFINYMESLRNSLPFEIDGLVIKINDKNLRNQLGETSHHPRWAMALKFESPKAISEVIGITIQIGRTGKVTPLALLKPVLVNGSTISKATLHNQDYINLIDLGISDIVEISKRGDIIPAVEKVITKNSCVYKIPLICPSCQHSLTPKKGNLFCENAICPDKMIQQIIYFTKNLDIEGFGDALIELLYHEFDIHSIPDLFLFDYTKLYQQEGFKEKKINKLQNNLLQSIQNTSFFTLLKALGMPQVSQNTLSILWDQGYSSLNKLNQMAISITDQELTSIHGIGELTCQKIQEYFHPSSLYSHTLLKLQKIGFSLEDISAKKSLTSQVLLNTQWVITGSFNDFSNRNILKSFIQSKGGKVSSSISKKTQFLLVGSQPAESKINKAKELNITILSEEQFQEKILHLER